MSDEAGLSIIFIARKRGAVFCKMAAACYDAAGVNVSVSDHQLADLLCQLILGVGLSELGDVKVESGREFGIS